MSRAGRYRITYYIDYGTKFTDSLTIAIETARVRYQWTGDPELVHVFDRKTKRPVDWMAYARESVPRPKIAL